MRLGLALPHYDTSYAGRPVTWESVRDAALLAEEAGFDSVWVSDHLFLDWGKYGGSPRPQGALECLTTLAGLAGSTRRVRLGSMALCNDLRNPGLVAKMAATLDLLSEGRLDIGMGGGWYEPEYRAAGIPFDGAGTRIRRLGEAAEIVVRLLEGEELTFKGEHYTLDGAICRPGPRQEPHPPLWIGGKGDLLLRIAAEVADGWNFSWVGSIGTYLARVTVADRACELIGRDPSSLRRSVGAFVLVGSDDADLRRRVERLLEVTPEGVLDTAVSLEELRTRAIFGTPERVIDELGRLDEAGVEEVVMTLGVLPFQLVSDEDVITIGDRIGPAIRRG
jgi:alkanesulfonate monooxygenase SsuD/methylene tetrahydromethanopterin reductase-like flavin-dependent oxidoreductase (luciferase family)